MKNERLNLFSISGTNTFFALIPSAWTLHAWSSTGHMFFVSVCACVCVCAPCKKEAIERERERVAVGENDWVWV